jgi:antitoxin MazE
MPIRARIIKIGNSQGIRIPKPVLEQAGLKGEVEIDVREGQIVLSAASEPRAGWAAAFETMARAGDDELLDGQAPLPTLWDDEGWQWP